MKSDGTVVAVPTTGDDVVFRGLPGVTQNDVTFYDHSAITLASLTIEASWAGKIGTTSTASADYFGYWKISATSLVIDGSGSSRCKINLGSVASTILIKSSGTSADTGADAIRLVGTSASNKLYLVGNGSTCAATFAGNLPGETGDLSGGIDVSGSATTLTLGPGVTWANAYAAQGATLNANSGGTALTVTGGAVATVTGTAKVTTVNNGGTVYLNNRPATDALNAYPDSTTDFSNNPATATVAAVNLYPGATIVRFPANPGHITFTALTQVNGGTLSAA
jgi:hypothetical protein